MFRFLFVGIAVLIPSLAFAVDAQELAPPDTVVNIMTFLQQLPYVGPYIFLVLKWVAIIAPVMTALSYVVQVILAIPELAARYSGAPAMADKIKYWADKINYYVKFLSIRNAQKSDKV